MADEQEWLAGERNEAEHGGNVDERLDDDKHGTAERGQAGEGVGSAGGDFEGAENEQDKQENEHKRTDKAELFRFDSENRVTGRLRQIAEFLDALAVAAACDAAGAYGDERLLDLIAGAERVGGGIEVGHDALAGIRPDVSHDTDGKQYHENKHSEMCPAGAACHQHAEAGDNDNDEGESVRLGEEQSAEDADKDKKWQDPAAERADVIFDMCEPCGEINNESDFEKFGRLKSDESQIDPPPCPAGDERQAVDKKETIDGNGDDEHCQSVFFPKFIWNARNNIKSDETENEAGELGQRYRTEKRPAGGKESERR